MKRWAQKYVFVFTQIQWQKLTNTFWRWEGEGTHSGPSAAKDRTWAGAAEAHDWWVCLMIMIMMMIMMIKMLTKMVILMIKMIIIVIKMMTKMIKIWLQAVLSRWTPALTHTRPTLSGGRAGIAALIGHHFNLLCHCCCHRRRCFHCHSSTVLLTPSLFSR